MIKLEPSQVMDEWTGFTVHDAKTGEPIDPIDVSMQSLHSASFAMSADGQLMAIFTDLWNDVEAVYIPKQGNYLIQFNDGRYLRW